MFTEGQGVCQFLSQSLDVSLSIRYRVEQFIMVGEGIQHKKGVDMPEFAMPLTIGARLNLLEEGRKKGVDELKREMIRRDSPAVCNQTYIHVA